MKLLGGQIICESLLREGVEVIFGYPGGAILPLYDAMWGYPQLRHVLVRHEEGAAHAADGYARVTGRPGVCMATSGPGATNLVTGIMAAKADSVPMVAITGQVARPVIGSEAFQECDICSIAAACTKMTYLVMSAQDLAPTIREAFRVAQEGRPGPVLIDVPRDVQLEEAEFEYPPLPEKTLPPVSEETLEQVQQAARLINQAERPGNHRRSRHIGVRRYPGDFGPGRDHRHPGDQYPSGSQRISQEPSPEPGHAGYARHVLV